MQVNAPAFRVSLQWGRPLTLSDGKGTCITARRGSVWITQDNDLRDVVLSGGESFLLEKPELAIVQAFDAAEIVVSPPPAPRIRPRVPTLAQRLLQAVRRASGDPAAAMG
jgi:L-lysine 2,3-aminomutase